MSLQKQLADLKHQKKQQARDLHRTYVHTKRDLKRAVSPDRLVRRHMGVSLGLAAVAGLILAPAPGHKAAKEKSSAGETPKEKRRVSSRLSMLKKLLQKVAPQAAAYLPNFNGDGHAARDHAKSDNGDAEKSDKKNDNKKSEEARSFIAPLLLEFAATALKKVDVQKLIADIRSMLQKRRNRRHDEHPPEPTISVADAGAIHDPPTDY